MKENSGTSVDWNRNRALSYPVFFLSEGSGWEVILVL